jgi:hypothetical protein
VVLNIAGALWFQYRLADAPQAVQRGLTPGVVWTSVIVSIVLFFVVLMPLVFLGMFITSKVMRPWRAVSAQPGAAHLAVCRDHPDGVLPGDESV